MPEKGRQTATGYIGYTVSSGGGTPGLTGFAGYTGARGYTGTPGVTVSPVARQRIMRMVKEVRPPPPPPMPWYCTIWTRLGRWLGWSTSESAE